MSKTTIYHSDITHLESQTHIHMPYTNHSYIIPMSSYKHVKIDSIALELRLLQSYKPQAQVTSVSVVDAVSKIFVTIAVTLDPCASFQLMNMQAQRVAERIADPGMREQRRVPSSRY